MTWKTRHFRHFTSEHYKVSKSEVFEKVKHVADFLISTDDMCQKCKTSGCVLNLQPVKLGTFFETHCSAISNDMKLIDWPFLVGGLLHLVQRGGDWVGPQPAQAPPRCTKCNSLPINGQCTNHRIMLYMLCDFNVF